MRTHVVVVGLAVVGVLLSGCGSGPVAVGVGPLTAVNPRVPGTLPQPSAQGSAADLARAIAVRWAATSAPSPGTAIEWQAIDYTASVFSPGTPKGFTAFLTTRHTIMVTAASAATIDASNGAPPRFATSADQALWLAAGRPSLGEAPASGQRLTIPVDAYSFLPQGSILTYRQAVALPADPARLTAAILDHLGPYAGPDPPASLELKQLSYLIATAPLTSKTRSAAWQAVAALPGLRTCQTRPHAIELCLDSTSNQTLVRVDPATGVILAIADRLLRPSPMYPHVSVGALDEWTTFLRA
jgi:hypothetical protein